MDRKELQIQMPKLKLRIPYDEDIFKTNVLWEQILTSLLEDSKAICLETLFPYDDYSNYLLPKKYYNRQIRCCIELYNLADKQGITNYSENSLAWSKLTDGLSQDLMSKLIPKIGVPKSSKEDDSNV